MRKALAGFAGLLAAGSLAFGVGPAQAAPEKPLAKLTILPVARLADDGMTMTVKLRITCQPVSGIMWEGFIGAEQGEAAVFDGLALTCDGRPHIDDVVLRPDDSRLRFQPGQATVSASILDENDMLKVYASDTRTVTVR